MSEIQDEAYSEAIAEIERLEQLNDDLIADKNGITAVASKAIAERDAEIAQLKAANTLLQTECAARATTIADLERLTIRAADALEEWHKDKFPIPHEVDLIAELRKAAW